VADIAARLFTNNGGQGAGLGSIIQSSLGSIIGGAFGGFRANGGPVVPGKAYVVGERRAELFVPRVPGDIRPSVGGGGRGVQQVVQHFDLRGAVVTEDLYRPLEARSQAAEIRGAMVARAGTANDFRSASRPSLPRGLGWRISFKATAKAAPTASRTLIELGSGLISTM
jgi:hypothetical protein